MAHKQTCIIQNANGLHARPAAMLVKTAQKFTADVQIEKDGNLVNAKSIMALMMLAAGPQSELTIHADGADEQQAVDAVCELINNKFGEA